MSHVVSVGDHDVVSKSQIFFVWIGSQYIYIDWSSMGVLDVSRRRLGQPSDKYILSYSANAPGISLTNLGTCCWVHRLLCVSYGLDIAHWNLMMAT